jgi:hypothetical protein
MPTQTAIRPPIAWRQRPPYPEPPAGYELVIYRSRAAAQASRVWGVRPVHIGLCTYALWVPLGAPPPDTPLRRDVADWLAAGGKAANLVCQREYPYGLARICAYAEGMGCPIPAQYTGRAADLYDFLAAAREYCGRQQS